MTENRQRIRQGEMIPLVCVKIREKNLRKLFLQFLRKLLHIPERQASDLVDRWLSRMSLTGRIQISSFSMYPQVNGKKSNFCVPMCTKPKLSYHLRSTSFSSTMPIRSLR